MSFKDFTQKNGSIIIIYMVLLVLILITSFLSPVFFTYNNLTNILKQAAALCIVSLGQTFILLLAGADLSVGATVSLVTVVCATLMKDSILSIFLSIIVCLCISAGIGAINGVLVSKGKLPALIATMSTMAIIQGITLLIMGSPGGYIPISFANFTNINILLIPFTGWLSISLFLVGIIVLRKSVLGNYIYATGGSESSAKLSGINTDKIKIISFTICGFMAGVAGLVLAGRIRTGDPVIGSSFNLDSMTAVILGGTSFDGGHGGIEGTLAGVFILSLLSNMLNLLNIPAFYQYIVKGLVLLAAVVLYSLRGKR